MSFKSTIKSSFYFASSLISRQGLLNKAAILMYHSIGDNDAFFTTSSHTFAKQMDYLDKHGFKVISLEELLNNFKNKKKIEAKTIVLTFDDGYEDNYTNAFPILQKYNFPATIFLTTDLIGQTANFKMLDWSQIKIMHQSGLIDFEPHTASHAKLTKLSAQEITKEIDASKTIIEKQLDKTCNFFAYPFGEYNHQVINIVKDHFQAAVTVKTGSVSPVDCLFELKRNSIDSQTSWAQFIGQALGLSEKFDKMKNIIKKH